MNIDRESLLDALREKYPPRSVADATGPGALPVELSALALAFATWEDPSLKAGLEGDKGVRGGSFSLFQINHDTWAKAIGAYDPARAEEGGLGYELDYAAPVFRQLGEALNDAVAELTAVVARKNAALVFDPIVSPVEWASIWWQYGGGAFGAWAKSPAFARNATAASFPAFRVKWAGKPVLSDFARRQKAIWSTYGDALESPDTLVAYWKQASIRLGVDLAGPALVSLGAPNDERSAWLNSTGEMREVVTLPAGVAPRGATREKSSLLSAALPGLVVSGLSAAAYFFLFEPDPDRDDGARRPHAEMVALVKSYATGLGSTFVLDKIKEWIG